MKSFRKVKETQAALDKLFENDPHPINSSELTSLADFVKAISRRPLSEVAEKVESESICKEMHDYLVGRN